MVDGHLTSRKDWLAVVPYGGDGGCVPLDRGLQIRKMGH